MNKEIKEKAEALNQWILNQDLIIEYKRYEKLIHHNKDLSVLEKELKDLQKEIVNQKHLGINCDLLIETYEKKKKSFDENPIVYNYLILKQEVNDFLSLIEKDINEELKKMVD